MNTVSVIVPIYNAEKYLDECIMSILQELRYSDELILINDGSTDNSPEICKKYVRKNVIFINNENQGVSHARNCGIECATCKYLSFVDSDDFFKVGWRKTFEDGIMNDTDIVYFTERLLIKPSALDVIEKTISFPNKTPIIMPASVCWKLYKREFVIKENIRFGYNIIQGEDSLFNLRLLLKGCSYSFIKTPTYYHYRTNYTSVTHCYHEAFNISNIHYIESVLQELTGSNLITSDCIQKYMNYIVFNSMYILINRISTLQDRHERKEKYNLFYLEHYHCLFSTPIPLQTFSLQFQSYSYLY